MIAQSRGMISLSVALPFSPVSGNFDHVSFRRRIAFFAAEPCVNRILILHQGGEHEARRACESIGKVDLIEVDSWMSGRLINSILDAAEADGLLLHLSEASTEFESRGLREFLAAAEVFRAGLVYSDSRKVSGSEVINHPRIDYQPGSIREAFGFGPVVFISKWAAEESLRKHGPVQQDIRWGGFYDLRLKTSIDFPIVRVTEPLYAVRATAGQRPMPTGGSSGKPFYIPERGNRDYQIELEQIATAHLRRIGAYVESGHCPPPASEDDFPVVASIIIPTRNRERTITDAIQSALNQATSFPYNIIVVDDHSTDKTREIVRQFAMRHENLVYILPEREDLGVGGLWNEAIYSRHCGLFAVQLDSDDVYAHDRAVEVLVNEFGRSRSGTAGDGRNAPRYAMVVGSFTPVNFEMKELSPGPVQRLDLSRENGRNNVLCLEGPGAPRAFYVPVLRRFGFPNVSFGEDYAVALRIGREFDVGRVFESVYLARQWDDNTQSSLSLGSFKSIKLQDALPPVADQQEYVNRMRPVIELMMTSSANRNDAYKDYLRTVEVVARSNRHRDGGGPPAQAGAVI